jgi:mannan endo-1,4-beta-mannosidase
MKIFKHLILLSIGTHVAVAQPFEERALATSWAGVNSYFLHAYQK